MAATRNQLSKLMLDKIHAGVYRFKGEFVGGIKARFSGVESFGEKPQIFGKVIFQMDGTAVIGDRFATGGFPTAITIKTGPSAFLSIGNDVGIGSGVVLEAWHDVRIGNNVMIAAGAAIIDDDRHSTGPDSIRYKGATIIGNNVWLGRNVAVMPGAIIGDNSIIGANSVVTREIPPNSFAAGAPARVIRKLEIPDGWVRYARSPASSQIQPQPPALPAEENRGTPANSTQP